MSLLKRKPRARGQPKVYVSKMGKGTSTSYSKKNAGGLVSKGVDLKRLPYRSRFLKVIRSDLKRLCFWRRKEDVLSIQFADN